MTKQLPLKASITCSYSLDEPVIKNRIEPLIKALVNAKYCVQLVNPKHIKDQFIIENNFIHTPLDVLQPNKSYGVFRLFREIYLSIYLLVKTKKIIYSDISIITIPSMFLLFVSKLYLKNFNGISVLDIRDLTWDYLPDKKISRIFKVLFFYFAKKSVHNFDFYLVTNPLQRSYLIKNFNIKMEKCFCYSNGISREKYNDLCELPQKYNNHDYLTISYVGNIGLAQSLDTLIEAAKVLKNVRFNIIGDGSDFNRIRKLSSEVPNMIFYGQLDWEGIINVYSQSDILWAQIGVNYKNAIPSKLYEYLAVGVPIIFGGLDAPLRVFKNFEGITFIQPESYIDLVEAIISNKVFNQDIYENRIASNRSLLKKYYFREDLADLAVKFLKDSK
ncbi:glycosyltransferase [Amylibacter sp.]|nr:glycosyltransferase [Amylibacter sp.]